jgi:HEAT repeat protein
MVYDDKITTFEADLESDPLAELDRRDGAPSPQPPDPDEMLALLKGTSSQKALAARAFCEIKDDRAIPYAIDLITDGCPLVRVAAAYALGHNPSQTAVEPLIAQLAIDINGHVRKGIVWALGNCRDRRSIPPLIHALKTDIVAVRIWAAGALAQAADFKFEDIIGAVPPIVEALVGDPFFAVRSNCAWTLGRLCRELPANVVYATAVDALIQSLEEDPDLGVRADAKASLLRLGDPRGLQAIEASDE